MTYRIVNPAALGTPRGWNNGMLAQNDGRVLFVAGQVGVALAHANQQAHVGMGAVSDERVGRAGPSQPACGTGPSQPACGAGPSQPACGAGPSQPACGTGPDEPAAATGSSEPGDGADPGQAPSRQGPQAGPATNEPAAVAAPDGSPPPREPSRNAPSTLAVQFGAALARVAAVVRDAGGTVADVGRLTIYVTDMDAYRGSLREVGAAYREVFGRHFPAMALVAVTELVDPRAVVEVEATAVIPQAQRHEVPAGGAANAKEKP